MSDEPSPRSTSTPVTGDFHPAANLFPLIAEQALDELTADIAANGLIGPIWRHRDGQILDGRNRWLACAKAGVECRHRTYDKGDETVLAFVISKNLHRRHLTPAQLAATAADIATLGRGANQLTVKLPSNEGTSQAQAARLMGVGVASVERAAAVKRADPELHEKVRAGLITAGAARAAIATVAPVDQPDDPEPESDAAVPAPDADARPSDGDRAFEAITAMARLRISGTATGQRYEWSDAEIRLAVKAAGWLRMFVRHAKLGRRS